MAFARIRAALLALLLSAWPAVAEVVQLDNRTLEQLMAEGVAVVDVRTPGEWQATGVVEGSHLLTFFDEKGRYDARAWLAELERLVPGGQPVILICATGGRTGVISKFLSQDVGRAGVHNVTGGISTWIGANKPVVAPKGQTQ